MRFAFLLLPVVATLLNAADSDPSSDLYDQVKRAAVEILLEDHLHGSGWFASSDGLVVTAAHVAASAKGLEVVSPTYGRMTAALVAIDRGHDLALLRVPARTGGYATLPLAKRTPKAGQPIYIFGAPIYRHGFLLRATMARNGTSFEYYSDQKCYVELVHAAGIGPVGVSGGPWVDGDGKVCAVQSGFVTDGQHAVGIVNGSPLVAIRSLIEHKQSAETPTLGAAVVELWEKSHTFLRKFPPHTEGLVADVVQAGGPAAKAGLKVGEVLIASEGQPVRLKEQFLRMVTMRKPGEDVKLTVLTGEGGTREITITLGKLEAVPENSK
ncbi:MAG TPA: S1C family serine protease [Planctomycetota bacterium]